MSITPIIAATTATTAAAIAASSSSQHEDKPDLINVVGHVSDFGIQNAGPSPLSVSLVMLGAALFAAWALWPR